MTLKQTSRYEFLEVARRAMACEFSILFPARTRNPVDAACAALDEVDRLENLLSVYRDDSELSRLNHGAAPERQTTVELAAILRLACRISTATGGGFDPATAALVRLWRLHMVPPAEAVEAARAAGGSRHVCFRRPGLVSYRRRVEFDLGAFGKGYAIDQAIRLMWNGFQVRAALMQAGRSSLFGLGVPPGERRGWAVDIGDPEGGTRSVARVWLRNRAMGTSGAAHQFFVENGRRYGHILDPRTGWPAEGLLSATAVAPRAAEADALSTAFYVLGTEWVREFCEARRDVGAVLVERRGTVVLGAVDVEVTR